VTGEGHALLLSFTRTRPPGRSTRRCFPRCHGVKGSAHWELRPEVVPGRQKAADCRLSPPPASTLRNATEAKERRGGEPQGRRTPSAGVRTVFDRLPPSPPPRRPPALPRPRVSPAFFDPFRIHAMGHSAAIPRRSRRPRLRAACRSCEDSPSPRNEARPRRGAGTPLHHQDRRRVAAKSGCRSEAALRCRRG